MNKHSGREHKLILSMQIVLYTIANIYILSDNYNKMLYHTEQVDLPIISGDINPVKHLPGEELTSTDEVYPSVIKFVHLQVAGYKIQGNYYIIHAQFLHTLILSVDGQIYQDYV